MRKTLLFICFVAFCSFQIQAQWSLGDIAFSGYQGDNGGNPSGEVDQFSFVLLRDVSSGESIAFTENGWLAAGGFRGGENTVTLTFNAAFSRGTEISIDATLDAKLADNTSVGNATGSAMLFSTSGDQIFAYDPGNTPDSNANQSGFIAAIQMNGDWDADATSSTTSAQPSIFGTLANSSIAITTEVDNAIFNCASGATIKGSPAVLRASLHDQTNWSTDNATPFDQPTSCGYEVVYVWSGGSDSDWATGSNWEGGVAPGTSDNVEIPNTVTNYPTISSAVTVNSMQITSGASVIANAAVTGNVTYTRNLPTTNWYLVSAPVSGETQEDVIANHTFATGTGSNIGIGAFTNNGASPWVYATAATTGALTSGLGVSMKLAAAGDVTITGTMNSSNVIFPVNTGTRNNFNLVGNPFTSYVNSATFASANTGLLSEETVWLWNGTAYVTYNAMTPIEIAPAQGFFVDASGAGNVTFATSNQSHQGTDTFLRQEPNPSFELFVDNGAENTSTKVFYANNKSAGFDNGYDSKMFGGIAKDFAVYTQLVANDQGNKLAIQTLPNADHATMVIPVGLIAKAGEEITFSITSANLPNGIDIYLEDRINNTFVNLSEGDHTITTKSALNGIGQYYIHANSAKLSNSDISQNIDNVSIYKSSKNEITVAGLQAQANVKVFSLLGEELINTDINSNGVSKVALPNLSTGVYVVKLNSVLGNITKKIILE